MSRFLWILLLLTASSLANATEIVVVGYNVESGDADPDIVAQRIGAMDGVDIWGFSEVRNSDWAEKFESAAGQGEGASFESILGDTGGADRLAIAYDADRFELVEETELDHINPEGRVRAPLVAHFREKSSGTEFLFMVNHLYRSRAGKRHLQAEQLNDWAETQALPVIAVGDYNFDWAVTDGDTDHDEG